MGGFLALVGLAGFGAWMVYTTLDVERPTADMKPGCRGQSNPALCRIIAEKWGPIFACPVETMMAIGKIESGFRPDCANFDIRALSRGGAFGMWQQTLSTAKGHARDLAMSTHPEVRKTLAKFKNRGNELLDPDVCGMFAAKQLGELWKQFGEFKAVAGAYHQGAGKIRSVLAAGGTLPDSLPPKGKVYVTRAVAARGTV